MRHRAVPRFLVVGTIVVAVVPLLATTVARDRRLAIHRVASAAAAPAPDPHPIPTASLIADAAAATVPVYAAPAAGPVTARIPGQVPTGQKEAFLVLDLVPGWYRVELPVKPNGATGWIPASSVTIRGTTDYLRVHQSQFRLERYTAGRLQQAFTVAVGAPSTPTPNGRFFVWASQDFAGAPYTPGIFALSGFSPVLDNWPGGGRAGIHGWTDTRVMGTRASHGCVRMAPADFAKLLHSVPLGTPVDILP